MTGFAISLALTSRNTEAPAGSPTRMRRPGKPIPRMGTIYAVPASEAELQRLGGLTTPKVATPREATPETSERDVPLSDQAMVSLDALSRREHFTGPDDLLFGNEVGEHGDGDAIRDRFYEAVDAAGLGHLRATDDPIVFHDLRHTFGTQCAAKGIDLPMIQRWMGHADIQTTMRYLHYVPAHDDATRLTAAFEVGTETGTEPPTPVRN
jgi:integrase